MAIVLVSCSSTQRYGGNDRNDRYGNVLSERDRYGDMDYNADWTQISKVRVASRNEEKKINVKRRDGKNIRQLLFRSDGPVTISQVDVKLSNGRTDELNIRNTRRNNRRSGDLNEDLILRVPDYGRTRIKEVIFRYDVGNQSIFSRRPTVSVYAR